MVTVPDKMPNKCVYKVALVLARQCRSFIIHQASVNTVLWNKSA